MVYSSSDEYCTHNSHNTRHTRWEDVMMEKMLSSNTELLRCCSDKRNNFCVDCSLKLTGIRVIYIKLRDDHAASNHYYIVIKVKNRDANTSSTTTECI